MEFKDNLKQLRMEKGLTQAQLAEKLFVSRSTVAKWENGLGLPNPESMAALEELFGVTAQEIATKEPENVIVQKNRKMHLMGQIFGCSAVSLLLIALFFLPYAIQRSNYGFTPEMAAGTFSDCEYIDTEDYRIYYLTFESDLEDGRRWSTLATWQIVEKHFWGYTADRESVKMNVITKENYVVGLLYSIKGEKGYYNLIKETYHVESENSDNSVSAYDSEELTCATSVAIYGTEYELKEGFFFITPEPVICFEIGDSFYNVITK